MKNVVVGGTGTLGRALVEKILKSDAKEVVCFSRDELKQKQLRHDISDSRLKFIIGDVKDKSSLVRAFDGAGNVFHVAALKHIDVVEDNPLEGVKTNILGTVNVAEAAMDAFVPYVIFSSTDKAVEPINVYGMTKAIAERYLFDLNRRQSLTRFSIFRWGNVLGSRGSVIHHFARCLAEKSPIPITHRDMTRFWIHIEDAVDFMLDKYPNAPKDRACIPPMKSSYVFDIAMAAAKIIGVDDISFKDIDMHACEKISECIESSPRITSDTCERFSHQELVDLIRPILTKGI